MKYLWRDDSVHTLYAPQKYTIIATIHIKDKNKSGLQCYKLLLQRYCKFEQREWYEYDWFSVHDFRNVELC